MARPKLTGPGAGPLKSPLDDPERKKASWFHLGGYFAEPTKKGNRGIRSSAIAQSTGKRGNRGIRRNKNEQTTT